MPAIIPGSALPVGAVQSTTIRTMGGGNGRSDKAASPAPSSGPVTVKSDLLDPGKAPIDADRVEIVRKAVESGTYPVMPARVADAIIAAGLLLRSGK